MKKQTLKKPPEKSTVIPISSDRQLCLSRPLIMGVLNVTPDSFSDGGEFSDVSAAAERAMQMIDEGADIIDIGGESSRPGAVPVDLDEELSRVVPLLQRLRQRTDHPISIDTYKAAVAEKALDEGADMVNDISAMRMDKRMAEVISRAKAPVILMHMLGKPTNMQENPRYDNCVVEIKEFLTEEASRALSKGIDKSKIIIDPGLGFGKRLSDNVEILSKLSEFKSLGYPILIGASRKSFIEMLSPSAKVANRRLGGSIAAATVAVINGVDIVRVHDVAETVEALKVVQASVVSG